METEEKQDKEFWDKFCKVINVDAKVSVQKRVTKEDIILSLLNEGDFIFIQEKGYTKMNLKGIRDKVTKENLKTFKDVLWIPIEEYLLTKQKGGLNSSQP